MNFPLGLICFAIFLLNFLSFLIGSTGVPTDSRNLPSVECRTHRYLLLLSICPTLPWYPPPDGRAGLQSLSFRGQSQVWNPGQSPSSVHAFQSPPPTLLFPKRAVLHSAARAAFGFTKEGGSASQNAMNAAETLWMFER